MRKFFVGLVVILILAGLVVSARTPNTQPKFMVSASFYPVYYFVQRIAGGNIKVINITPPGAEPHDYNLTATDRINLQKSQLVFVNGMVEPWADKLQRKVVVLKDDNSNPDPHIWLDPVLAKTMVEKISVNLRASFPQYASSFNQSEALVLKELDELDAEYKSGLFDCFNRNVITAHKAFGYLTHRYNLNQIAIAGLSPDAEPSLQKMAELVKYAKNNHVEYIFFETLVSPKLANTLAREVGAKTLVLDPIEGLTGDDYFIIMRRNLDNLRKAGMCR